MSSHNNSILKATLFRRQVSLGCIRNQGIVRRVPCYQRWTQHGEADGRIRTWDATVVFLDITLAIEATYRCWIKASASHADHIIIRMGERSTSLNRRNNEGELHGMQRQILDGSLVAYGDNGLWWRTSCGNGSCFAWEGRDTLQRHFFYCKRRCQDKQLARENKG